MTIILLTHKSSKFKISIQMCFRSTSGQMVYRHSRGHGYCQHTSFLRSELASLCTEEERRALLRMTLFSSLRLEWMILTKHMALYLSRATNSNTGEPRSSEGGMASLITTSDPCRPQTKCSSGEGCRNEID